VKDFLSAKASRINTQRVGNVGPVKDLSEQTAKPAVAKAKPKRVPISGIRWDADGNYIGSRPAVAEMVWRVNWNDETRSFSIYHGDVTAIVRIACKDDTITKDVSQQAKGFVLTQLVAEGRITPEERRHFPQSAFVCTMSAKVLSSMTNLAMDCLVEVAKQPKRKDKRAVKISSIGAAHRNTKRKETDEERKTRLRAQLAKGRATLAEKRRIKKEQEKAAASQPADDVQTILGHTNALLEQAQKMVAQASLLLSRRDNT
jgi:hypothetical protein